MIQLSMPVEKLEQICQNAKSDLLSKGDTKSIAALEGLFAKNAEEVIELPGYATGTTKALDLELEGKPFQLIHNAAYKYSAWHLHSLSPKPQMSDEKAAEQRARFFRLGKEA
jgi:hypothetical protein